MSAQKACLLKYCAGSDRTNVVGLILVKELIKLVFCKEQKRVRDVHMRSLPSLPTSTPMFDLLNLFQTGRTHMVLLTRPPILDVPDTLR